MAYEDVTSLDCDKVYSLGAPDNPRKLEGYYLGTRVVNTDTGESKIHVFQTPQGNMGVWGSADTNAKLASVKRGTMTLVEFVEKKKIGGGKTKKVFKVQQDRSNTIDVGFEDTSSSTDTTNDEQSYEASDDTTDNYEDTATETFEQQAAARKTQVQNLLSRKK